MGCDILAEALMVSAVSKLSAGTMIVRFGMARSDGQVVDRVMGGAEGAVADTCADADQLDGLVRVADVVLDLLQGPGREEARRGHGVHDLARRGQSSSHADEVLLCDADLHELIGKSGRKAGQPARSPRVAGHGQDVPVVTGQGQQRLGKDVQVGLALFRACLSVHAPPPATAQPAPAGPARTGSHWARRGATWDRSP